MECQEIKEVGRLQRMCREMDRNNIEMLGMSETSCNGSGSFKTCTTHTLIFAGKEEGCRNGRAVVLNKAFIQSLLGYAPVSDRILKIRLQAKPLNISIIQFYASTNTASEEEIEEFYNVLQEEIDSIPSCDIKVVMGDANITT